MSCPNCKESARFVTYRDKTLTSLLGDIRFGRAYYHCGHCAKGHFSWDDKLRLTTQRYTPAAQEVIATLGIQQSFCKVAEKTLEKVAGLKVSESTVERITEATGQRLGEMLNSKIVFGNPSPWKWNSDWNDKKCGYISIDATGILMQGSGGTKADGRMVYLGMVYNPKPRGRDDDDKILTKPCEDVRYLAGLYSLDELGEQLRWQAGQVGMNDVDQWIALSDAGNGLENFFDVYFPRAVKIVDFRHATEHLSPVAKGFLGGKAGDELLSEWCHRLKHKGGADMLAVLQGLDRTTMDQATLVKLDEAITYFGNHSGRMNYPEYLKNGWQIGSGSIESGCKNVINGRLSMGGMRWGEDGGDNVSHLRALFCSESARWDAFWALAG